MRLYAEDPAEDYQPQSGLLTRFEIPTGDGVRVDSGFETGSEVSTHYDAMLAKVIAYAPTRDQAARKLAGALSRAKIHGVVTNRDLLVAILRDPEFLAGGSARRSSPTGLDRLDHRRSTRRRSRGGGDRAGRAGGARRATVQRGIPVGVAQRRVAATAHRVRGRHRGRVAGRPHRLPRRRPHGGRGPTARPPDRRRSLETDGVRTTYDVAVNGNAVDVDSTHGHVRLDRVPRFVDPADAVASGSLLAPMPGTVVKVLVEQGAEVAAGDAVLVLEAMKMQHTVSAPHAGTVTEINIQPGTQVAAGEVLAVVEGEDA